MYQSVLRIPGHLQNVTTSSFSMLIIEDGTASTSSEAWPGKAASYNVIQVDNSNWEIQE